MCRRAASLLIVSALASLAGCTSSAMRKVGTEALPLIEAERAQVVFMRPSSFGGAIQSSVFELDPAGDKLVGIVSAGTKVAHVTAPGEHLFMVIGENADFMRATLAPGRTYYALVTPRVGWWKARFSLRPVHADELDRGKVAKWVRRTTLVENTEASERWAKENWRSIQAKKAAYLPKWEAKPEAARDAATLRESDGR